MRSLKFELTVKEQPCGCTCGIEGDFIAMGKVVGAQSLDPSSCRKNKATDRASVPHIIIEELRFLIS